MSRLCFGVIWTFLAVVSTACSNTPTSPGFDGVSGATASGLSARGGNRPPTDVPVTAEFRCPGPACTAPDRIQGDGGAYAAILDGGGNLRLTVSDAGRSILMDYTDCVQPCPAGRRWFTTQTVTAANSLNVHTSVLVPGTESETPNGFLDIPVGTTWFSRIKIGYSLTSPTGTNLVFGMRFNPFFPGSTNLTVSRVSDNVWFVEATTAQTAWAVSLGATKRDGGEVFEGNYLMPFGITVTR